jgi:Flp pilus assembly pilin Flp
MACFRQVLLTAESGQMKLVGLSEYGRRIGPWDGGTNMKNLLQLWRHDEGQDIAEYAVMLAVILVLVVGTIRLIGSNSNTVFSNVASSIQ